MSGKRYSFKRNFQGNQRENWRVADEQEDEDFCDFEEQGLSHKNFRGNPRKFNQAPSQFTQDFKDEEFE